MLQGTLHDGDGWIEQSLARSACIGQDNSHPVNECLPDSSPLYMAVVPTLTVASKSNVETVFALGLPKKTVVCIAVIVSLVARTIQCHRTAVRNRDVVAKWCP